MSNVPTEESYFLFMYYSLISTSKNCGNLLQSGGRFKLVLAFDILFGKLNGAVRRDWLGCDGCVAGLRLPRLLPSGKAFSTSPEAQGIPRQGIPGHLLRTTGQRNHHIEWRHIVLCRHPNGFSFYYTLGLAENQSCSNIPSCIPK